MLKPIRLSSLCSLKGLIMKVLATFFALLLLMGCSSPSDDFINMEYLSLDGDHLICRVTSTERGTLAIGDEIGLSADQVYYFESEKEEAFTTGSRYRAKVSHNEKHQGLMVNGEKTHLCLVGQASYLSRPYDQEKEEQGEYSGFTVTYASPIDTGAYEQWRKRAISEDHVHEASVLILEVDRAMVDDQPLVYKIYCQTEKRVKGADLLPSRFVLYFDLDSAGQPAANSSIEAGSFLMTFSAYDESGAGVVREVKETQYIDYERITSIEMDRLTTERMVVPYEGYAVLPYRLIGIYTIKN